MIQAALTLVQSFPYALAVGLLVASVCSLLGLFTILQRMVFIGITLSEVASCGVAIALSLGLPPFAGAAALTLGTIGLLALSEEGSRLPRDAVLGTVFVASASLGLLVVFNSAFELHDVKALLYGELIFSSAEELLLIVVTLVPVLAGFLLFLRPTLYAFLDRDAAQLLGVRVRFWEGLYFVSLGLTVSVAAKLVGAILIFCYLVVSPSTALLLSRRLTPVLVLAPVAAVVATMAGLLLSVALDYPTNQTIAVVACLGLLCAAAAGSVRKRLRSPMPARHRGSEGREPALEARREGFPSE